MKQPKGILLFLISAAMIVAVISAFSACAKVTLQCPTNGQMQATLNNPSIVDIAGGLMTLLAASGLVAARTSRPAAAPTPVSYSGTMTWSTFALLGQQSAACGQVAPIGVTQ